MTEPKERGLLSHQEIDNLAEAIRAARMIAEVVSRTVCEGLRRQDDGRWELTAADGDLLDFFTGEAVAALNDIKAQFEAAVGSAAA